MLNINITYLLTSNVLQDEIGTEAEALAARSIAQRGVQLVATAHGGELARLIKNPTLSDLIGGIQTCAPALTALLEIVYEPCQTVDASCWTAATEHQRQSTALSTRQCLIHCLLLLIHRTTEN